jgi:hypothetical protein
MTSIIKVDAIQMSNGDTPSISDMGFSALTQADIPNSATYKTQANARTSQHSLGGDSGWVDHLSMAFTLTKDDTDVLFLYSSSSSYESGPVQGFARILLDGVMIGYNSCVGKQADNNSAGPGTVIWHKQSVSAGTYTVKIQIRNTQGGSTWITPYYDADGQTANTLTIMYYGK